MNRTPLTRPWLAVAATAAVAVLAACASAPTSNARLEVAKTAYQSAATDADVVRAAPVELRRAQEAIQSAEAALRAGAETADVEHQAYLAAQLTAAARETARIAAAERAVQAASDQRDRILIDSRTAEAQTQRTQADAARRDAESARRLAEDRLAAAQASQAQAAAAAAKAKSLSEQLAALQAKQTDRGMVLTLGDVLFDTGRAELKPGANRTMDDLATFLREHTERTVTVEGHTDSVGSDALNFALSERRAAAVKAQLLTRGIAPERVTTRGFGRANPVAGNDTAAGRQQNRRVEIVFSQG